MKFSYFEAKSIEEAISLLSEYGEKAKIIAGGTDLLVQIRGRATKPEYVIDIGGIAGLDYIKYDKRQGLTIGVLTPIRVLEKSSELQERFPIISQAASQLGSVAIRNVGTIGGNLCNASPSADMAPPLIGLSANAKLVGPGRERLVPLEDFFTGPGTTVLGKGEMLVEIQVPVSETNTKGIYLKHGLRGTIDLAIVGVAAVAILEADSKICKDIKIALGAVAPTPMRAREAEGILRNKRIDEVLINKSAEAAADEARPISDVRASAGYRKEMVKVFTRRAIEAVVN